MTFEGEGTFVGLVSLALVGLIAVRMVRGLRSGRLPLYRTYIDRSQDERRFHALLAVHGVLLLLIGFIAADLLLGLGFRN